MVETLNDTISVTFTAANDLVLTYKQQTIRLTPVQAKRLHDVIELKYGMPGLVRSGR
jgi:hypothetical protein